MLGALRPGRHAHPPALAVLALILGVVMAGNATAGELTRADDTRADAVRLGRSLYAAHCASCHGANLEGQENWKKELPEGGRPAPPHDQTGHTWHHDDALLFNITKFGPRAFDTGDYVYRMPAFEGVLGNHEIWSVLAFIKSTWPRDEREYQRQLNRDRGIE